MAGLDFSRLPVHLLDPDNGDLPLYILVAVALALLSFLVHGLGVWLSRFGLRSATRRGKPPVAWRVRRPLAAFGGATLRGIGMSAAIIAPVLVGSLFIFWSPVDRLSARLLIWAGTGAMSLHVWLSLRFAWACVANGVYDGQIDLRTAEGAGPSLPPSLVNMVTQLRERLNVTEPYARTELVQLRGPWGSGKSAVLAALLRDLRGASAGHDRRPVAIYYDAWQELHDREPLLDLIEHLAAALLHPLDPRWLAFPTRLLLGSALVNAGPAVLRLGPTAGVSVESELPRVRLRHQPVFERLVATAQRRSRRVVVIIDELERTGPHRLEALLVTVRRALDINGVSIVMAYAEDVIIQKAFSPQVVLAEYERNVRRPSRGSDARQGWGFGRGTLVPHLHPNSGQSDLRSSTAAWLIMHGVDSGEPLPGMLPGVRAKVAAEKFLGSLAVTLPTSASPGDVQFIMQERKPIRSQLGRLLQDESGGVSEVVRHVGAIDDPIPATIREAENLVAEALSAVELDGAGSSTSASSMSTTDLVKIVVEAVLVPMVKEH